MLLEAPILLGQYWSIALICNHEQGRGRAETFSTNNEFGLTGSRMVGLVLATQAIEGF